MQKHLQLSPPGDRVLDTRTSVNRHKHPDSGPGYQLRFIKGLILSAILFIGAQFQASAQLTGVKTIPGDYATIAAAITDLNTAGVGTGGVTFNIAAGYTETAANLTVTATGTSANPIVFQKSGTGANPKITAGVGTSTTVDGIIKLAGTDYITFDGLDMEDPATNTTTTTQMEWGIALLKVSVTNGSQFVTIKNCNITLQRSRTTGVGIYGAHHTTSSSTSLSTTGVTVDGANSNNKIFGNTINNCYTGIRLEGSSATVFDLNNEVGVAGANIITNFGGAGTTAYGIYSIYQDNFKVANNNLNGGSGTTTTLYGIFLSTAVNANSEVFNNTVSIAGGGTTSTIYGISNGSGGTGTNNIVKIYGNTVQNSTYTTATSGIFYAIHSSTTVFNIDIYNNTIRAINKPGTGTFIGIYQVGNVINNENIYGNTITDINSTGSGTFHMIYSNATSTTKSAIYGNTIRDVSAASATINGISSASTATSNIYGNNIYNLTSTPSGGVVYGLNLTGGTANYAYNNFISDLKAPASTNSDAVRGISVSGGTASSIFYNTIFLNASSSSATTFGTSGVYASSTPTVELRNNIIVNISTPGPTGGSTAAYRRSSTTLTTYSNGSNTNLFYAGTPSANQVIFTDGTNSDQTLSAYKTRVAPRDAASVSALPPFVNIITAPYDLHIKTTVPTQVESAATPVTTPIAITTDFDGQLRDASTPDIGADEGNFMPQDLTPPSIIYTTLANTLNTTGDRTLTATISDANGVYTTGSLVPRIYFRLNSGTWMSTPGVLTSGTGTNGTWTFTISGTLLGTRVAGDVVSYYVIAQDMANPDNVGSSPSGVVATNVNTITSHPASPNSYLIQTTFSGTINVGSTETITSLTGTGGLFDQLNNNAMGGNLTVNITSDLAETGAVALNQILEVGTGGYTLTIQPSAAVNRIISGTVTGGLIRLNGADRVIFNGNFGGSGRFLTIMNNTTATNSAAIQIISLGTGAGAINNAFRNLNIAGGSNSVTSAFGIYAGSATISTTGTGAENNGLTIDNNVITKAYYAIYARGVASTGLLTGLTITNNTIGSNTAADYVTYRGVDIQNATAPLISSNTIFNLQLTTSATNIAIEIGQNSSDAMVTRNRIYGLRTTSTSGYGSYGINIASATGNTNITIANNMISDIVAANYSATSTAANPFGIRITGGTNHKIYYNSIYLFGAPTTGTAASMSAPIIITSSTATGLDIRNNILANSMTGVTGTKTYAIYAVSGTTFGTINYNDYYAPISGYLGSDKVTLAEWQAATTQDANSLKIDPEFVSATDLHISAFDLNNVATPIAAVTIDFDGDLRSATTPDIGADEFNLVTLDLGPVSLGLPAIKSCYGSNEQVAIRIRNLGSSPINFTTNPVTITANVSGAATQTFSPVTVNTNTLNGGAPLASGASINVPVGTLNMTTTGAYTFNATTALTGDLKANNDVMTPVTRTVDPLVVGTVTAGQNTFCQSGTPTLTLSGSTGGDIQWQQSTSATGPFTNITGATNVTYSPATALNQTMYFQAIVSCGTNNSTSNVVLVTVNNPQVTAAPVLICGPGTATLTATPSAGANLTWYDAATGGIALGTGNTYSPTVSANTTYYVEPTIGQIYRAGLTGTGSYGTYGSPGSTGYGLTLTITQPGVIDSAYIYPVSAGNVVVQLYTRAGVAVGSPVTVPVTTADVGQKTGIALNIVVTNPGDYNLINITGSVYLNRYNPYSGPAYPFSSAGNVFTITGGATSSSSAPGATTYYSFFNLRYNTSCVGNRIPVTVTVNSPAATPTITAAGATTFCSGGSVALTAASTSTGATYQWLLNGNQITGATSATYTANAAGNYTVIATANGCPSAPSAATTVTVNAAPATPTITVAAGGSTTICTGGSVGLTGASTTTGATYQWLKDGTPVTGATAATYSATAAGSYTVIASANGCSSAPSAATVVTVNTPPATPTISQNGGTLTSSSATGNQWYLNGTLIPGATGQTLITTANGAYTLIVTGTNGCASALSAVKNVTNTGLGDVLAGMSVQVYPNPTYGSFNVKLNGYQKDASVMLYSLTGQLIVSDKATADGKARNINVKGLAAGTYLLKVTSDNGVQVTRLIVQ